MSTLPLPSASDATSPGSHTSIQRPRSSSSPSTCLTGTGALGLKSFLLDEEIRLQQQRLQHMLHLRQQQLQEHGQAHLEQEIQYKHLLLQQRFLTLTGELETRGHLFGPSVPQLPPCAARNPLNPPVAISENDASVHIEREHPHHVVQATDEQLSVSQLQPVGHPGVDGSASVIVRSASSSPQTCILPSPPVPQHDAQKSGLKQDIVQRPFERQHHVQDSSLQQTDVQRPVRQQVEPDPCVENHSPSGDTQFSEQRTLHEHPVQRHMCQQEAHPTAAAAGWREPIPVALETASTCSACTSCVYNVAEQTRAAVPLVSASSSALRRTSEERTQVLDAASPSCLTRRSPRREARAQREAGKGLHVGSILLQEDSLTSQNASTLSGGATTAGSADSMAVPLQLRGVEEKESTVSGTSRDAASIIPRRDTTTGSPGAADYAPDIVAPQNQQEQRDAQRSLEIWPEIRRDCSARSWNSASRSPRNVTCAMKSPISATSHTDKVFSANALNGVHPDGTASTTNFCVQNEMHNTDTDCAVSLNSQERSVLRSVDLVAMAPAASTGGEAHQCATQEDAQRAQANQCSNEDRFVGASTEPDSVPKGKISLSKLDLTLAMSQQLRSSHVARGTESAVVEELEEMLEKSTAGDGRCSSQQQKQACSQEERMQGRLTRSSGERGGEKTTEDSLTCGPLTSRGLGFSDGITSSRKEQEGSDRIQLKQLAEKLREQETEKRLMQEESFQLEQMLKRQYFQDIQRKEAEKEELQHQLTYIKEISSSLQQRLADVTQQKDQLYDIVILAQEALAEAVATTPWSPRPLTSPRTTRDSPHAANSPEDRPVSSAEEAAAAEACSAPAAKADAGEADLSGHLGDGSRNILCEQEEEAHEGEALRVLLADREEVSNTLVTLVNKLKETVSVLDTHELAREEEAALRALLQRAVVACNVHTEQVTGASGFSKVEGSSKISGDVPSDDTKTDSQYCKDLIASNEEDAETAQQLRQLQEEVNVLRRNLRSFTDAVLATQMRTCGDREERRNDLQRTSAKDGENAVASVDRREMLPPQKLMLQRLEELQLLNAKLLHDNAQLHRLCVQQAIDAAALPAFKLNLPRSAEYRSTGVPAALSNQTASPGLGPVANSFLNQKVHHISRDNAHFGLPSYNDVAAARSEAPPRTVLRTAAPFSPISAAPPPNVGSVASQPAPYHVIMSPSISHTPVLSYSSGGHLAGSSLALNTAGKPAEAEADAAIVGTSYNAAQTKRSCTVEGRRTLLPMDATELCNSGQPRCMYPQLPPTLRRELWRSPGPAVPASGLQRAPSYQTEEHGLTGSQPLLHTQRSCTSDQARRSEDEKTHADGLTQHTYILQKSSDTSAGGTQQLPLISTNRNQGHPRAVTPVGMALSSPMPQIGAAENAAGPPVHLVQYLQRQPLHAQRRRQSGPAHSAYPSAPAAETAFPPLPQYSKSGRSQEPQRETPSRPLITPATSASRLPLLRTLSRGGSVAQAQQQRVRALSSGGSTTIDRKLPLSQSLTLLRPGYPWGQSRRKLLSRSHSQLLTAETDNPCLEESVGPVPLHRGVSPVGPENCDRIDLTVWGQRMVREKTRNRGAANAAVAAGRGAGATAVDGRHMTEGFPARLFMRTRRASAVVSADNLPVVTPAHSDSRLPTEDRHRRQQRGRCALGRCWLGLGAAFDKTSEGTHHVPPSNNARLRPSLASQYVQPISSKPQGEAARPHVASPLLSFAPLPREHPGTPGNSVPPCDSPGLQSHPSPSVLPSPTGGASNAETSSPFAVRPSQVMLLHSPGDACARHHSPDPSTRAGIVPRASPFPLSHGSSHATLPSFATSAINHPTAFYVPTVYFPPPPSAMPPSLPTSPQILYDKGGASSACRESMAPQSRFTAGWVHEAPKINDKIPAAQELWQRGRVAQQQRRGTPEAVGRTQGFAR